MNISIKTSALVILSLAMLACANNDDEEPNNKPVNEKVSFKAITNAWFDQAPDDEAPSPEDVNFEFDADEDETAFDTLLETNVMEETI